MSQRCDHHLLSNELTGVVCLQPDIEEIKDLSEKRAELMQRVTLVLLKVSQFRQSFDQFAYLWTDDRAEFMRQFLLYNHVLTSEEVEQHAEEGIPEIPPTLLQFQEQVIACDVNKIVYNCHTYQYMS